jgi:hypothetical protein
MADKNSSPFCSPTSNTFKEAVCVDASRIFDSCSDKDCLEDLRVYFTDDAQNMIDNALNVKCRKVEVLNVFLDIEPVQFNRGFYSVDMTFFFEVKVDVFMSPVSPPCKERGFAFFTKKVILYGSEGAVRVFSSDDNGFAEETSSPNDLPKATVQVVDPLILSSKLCEYKHHHKLEPAVNIPSTISNRFEGTFGCAAPQQAVLVTLGLFSIVHLERSVQMMIPVYDYCIPDKEAVTSSDDPCELFRRIKFPVNEFFPTRLADVDDDEKITEC